MAPNLREIATTATRPDSSPGVTTGVFPGAIASLLGDPAGHVQQLTITEDRPENEEDS